MMKSDDPRLIESHKRLTEEVKKLDDMIVTVLKYHVGVERSMVEFIEAHGKKADDTLRIIDVLNMATKGTIGHQQRMELS